MAALGCHSGFAVRRTFWVYEPSISKPPKHGKLHILVFKKTHTHTHTHTSTLEWLGGAGGCGWVGGWGWWGGAGWWLGGVGRVGWWVGVGLGRWAGWSFRCACFLTMPPLRCTHTDIRLHVFVFSVRPDLGVNQKIILCSMHRSQNYFLSLGNKPLEPAPSLSQAGFLGMGVHPPPT
jgi:hypothetical protein